MRSGPARTYHDKAHFAHGLLVVVVHLADQGIAQVHGDALDGLVLPCGVEDAEQELIHAAVLELQLLGDAEVAEGQAAVPLHLRGTGPGRACSQPWGAPEAWATWAGVPRRLPGRSIGLVLKVS